jgi:hypothetical protein
MNVENIKTAIAFGVLETLAFRSGLPLTGERVHARQRVLIVCDNVEREEIAEQIIRVARRYQIDDLSGIHIVSGLNTQGGRLFQTDHVGAPTFWMDAEYLSTFCDDYDFRHIIWCPFGSLCIKSDASILPLPETNTLLTGWLRDLRASMTVMRFPDDPAPGHIGRFSYSLTTMPDYAHTKFTCDRPKLDPHIGARVFKYVYLDADGADVTRSARPTPREMSVRWDATPAMDLGWTSAC